MPCGDQFLDILVALWMPALRRVGVGQFIDDDDRGAARQCRVEVEFLDGTSLVLDLPARQHLQAVEQVPPSRRAHASRRGRQRYRRRHPSDGARAPTLRRSCRRRVPRREKASDGRGRPVPQRQQRIGVGAFFKFAERIRHALIVPPSAPSSARLISSTLMRGSPMIPNSRPLVWCSTSAATCGSEMARLGDRGQSVPWRIRARCPDRGRNRKQWLRRREWRRLHLPSAAGQLRCPRAPSARRMSGRGSSRSTHRHYRERRQSPKGAARNSRHRKNSGRSATTRRWYLRCGSGCHWPHRESSLADAGDGKRIGYAGEQGEQHCHDEGRAKMREHDYTRWRAETARSTSLMPAKGKSRPPRP